MDRFCISCGGFEQTSTAFGCLYLYVCVYIKYKFYRSKTQMTAKVEIIYIHKNEATSIRCVIEFHLDGFFVE